jgi:hypothetical protein
MNTTEIVFESPAQVYWRDVVEMICGKHHGLWIGGNGETIEVIGELPLPLRKGFKPALMWDQTRPRDGVLWDDQFAIWHLTPEARSCDPRIGIPTMGAFVDLVSKRRELLGIVKEGK